MAKTPPFPELDPGRKRTAWETIVITTPVILTVIRGGHLTVSLPLAGPALRSALKNRRPCRAFRRACGFSELSSYSRRHTDGFKR